MASSSDDDDDDPILAQIRKQIQDDDVKYGAPSGPTRRQTTETVVRHVRDAGQPRGMPAPAYKPRLVVARRGAETGDASTASRTAGTSAASGREPGESTTTTDVTRIGSSHLESSAALASLEAILADDSAFRPSRPASDPASDASTREIEETVSRVDLAASEAERTRAELRARVVGIMSKVDDMTASSERLREIESMAAELHERTADFSAELKEVARINEVRLDDD